MNSTKFHTLRHIEVVRNYINEVIKLLMDRGEKHDQSKMQSPEVEIFTKFTPMLRKSTYGSPEYYENLKEMTVALTHHYSHNRHHPEYHENGMQDMNLIDLIELLIDWKAASLRHANGDIWKSIELNQERFGYSNEMKDLLKRTMEYIEEETDVTNIIDKP